MPRPGSIVRRTRPACVDCGVPDASPSAASQIRSQRGTERTRAPETPPVPSVSLRARVIAGYLIMLVLFATVLVTVLVQLQRLQRHGVRRAIAAVSSEQRTAGKIANLRYSVEG